MNDRLTKPAAEAAAFFREVARDGLVWTLRDRGGLPAPVRPDRRRVQPFWSSRARAARLAGDSEAFNAYEPVAVAWTEFRDRWLPGFERDALLVGINWCGARAVGYDMEPHVVRERVARAQQALERAADARRRRRTERASGGGSNSGSGFGGSGAGGAGVGGAGGGAGGVMGHRVHLNDEDRRQASG